MNELTSVPLEGGTKNTSVSEEHCAKACSLKPTVLVYIPTVHVGFIESIHVSYILWVWHGGSSLSRLFLLC